MDTPPTDTVGPLLLAAAAGSLAVSLIGDWFLLRPQANVFLDPALAMARTVLDAGEVSLLLVGLGLTGVLVALLAMVSPTTVAVRRVLLGVAGVEVLGLGVGLQSASTIALAGYLLAMALPVGLVWMVAQVVRRSRRLRWPVLALTLAAVGWGWVGGPLRPRALAALVAELGHGFAVNAIPLLVVVLIAAATAAWVLVLVWFGSRTRHSRTAGSWVLRHRRLITLVAAAGPVPYGLIRASWLTPWPLLVPAGEGLTPEIRLWGLLLGGGAVLGAALTVGLIRPWSVRFPRWMPLVAGRLVPVRAAVIPGGVVAGIVCASALPMLRAILTPEPDTVFGGASVLERFLATLVFPFWIWGPALALAVWGYARSRGEATAPRTPPTGG